MNARTHLSELRDGKANLQAIFALVRDVCVVYIERREVPECPRVQPRATVGPSAGCQQVSSV